MRLLPLVAALVLAVPLAGCTLVPEVQPRDIAGKVDGYDPTASHLKVHVLVGNDTMLFDFDRRDWNVMGIAKAIDERTVTALSVHGMPREILNEILVQSVGEPSIFAKYRWSDSTATPEERSALEAAYDELVAKQAPIEPALPATPSVPLLPPP